MIDRARQLVVLLLVFSTGCASPLVRLRSPRELFSRTPVAAQQEELSPQLEDEKENNENIVPKNSSADPDSPSKPSEKSKLKSAMTAQNLPEDTNPWKSESTPSESTSSESAEPKSYKHDVATRMIIDAELRGATSEEREAWLLYLSTIETSQVPKELQIRRSLGSDAKPPQTASIDSNHPLDSDASRSAFSKAFDPQVTPTSAESKTEKSFEAATTTSDPIATSNANSDASEHLTDNPADHASVADEPNMLSSWPRKIKSLTEPSWAWSHTQESDASASAPPEKSNEKSLDKTSPKSKEKSSSPLSFNLPLIRGSQARAETANPLNLPPEEHPIQKTTPTLSPATPKLTPGSQLWEDEIQKLISLLEAETSISGQSEGHRDFLRKQVILRMLYVIENDPIRSQQTIAGLSPTEQEFWTELFMGLSQHLDQSASQDPGERATQTVAHLRNAAHQLQKNARLRLRNMTFCQKINGFGSYDIFPIDEFIPAQTVLLYTEIRNFQSDATAEGIYLTRIKSTIEIYANGQTQQLVDRSTFDATEDHCRTLRSDYFHSYRISLPPQLAAGPHTLKLIVEDELSGKTAVESIEFEVRK